MGIILFSVSVSAEPGIGDINEEEGDPMPATTVTEGTFLATTGATATQADTAGTGGAAPSTRYYVRIVNTHTTDRLYIATSQSAAQTTTAEIVEPDWGEWFGFLRGSVSVWVRPVGSNSITVRIIQYAT